MAVDHIIDPNGDVVLVIANLSAPTADVCDRPCAAATAPTLRREPTDPIAERPKKRARTSGKKPASTGEPTSSKVKNPTTQKPRANGQKPEPTPIPDSGPKEICIQVSGKQLSLASSLFAQMVQAAVKKKQAPKGRIEVNLVGWDLNALLIVLYIIHEQHDKVPRRLGIQILAKVALIATYYGCACVLPYGDIWHESLKNDALPDSYGNELCLLLWVSNYFRWVGCFNACCLICVDSSPSVITFPGFPVLEQTIGTSRN
jgi:hypothetical protein